MQNVNKIPDWIRSRIDPVESFFRIVFGGVFFTAGAIKMSDLLAFESALRNYRLLSDPFIAWVTMGVPSLELIAGTAVILRVFYPGCVILLCGALIIFMGALISLLVRGIDTECGCLGIITTIQIQLIFDLALLAIGAGLLWSWRKTHFKVA